MSSQSCCTTSNAFEPAATFRGWNINNIHNLHFEIMNDYERNRHEIAVLTEMKDLVRKAIDRTRSLPGMGQVELALRLGLSAIEEQLEQRNPGNLYNPPETHNEQQHHENNEEQGQSGDEGAESR